MQVASKVVLITGASSGIGRALAVELGLRGARVVAAARSLEKLAETGGLLSGYGIEHHVMQMDVTSQESVQEVLDRTIEAYGAIDIFVNNAGIGLFQDTLLSSMDDVNAVFSTNLWGPLAAMQKVVPRMTGGMLVNISSAAAKYSPYRQGIYAASKAALERMTEAISVEQDGRIRTLLVVPDRTDTPFMQHVTGPKENAKLSLEMKSASTEVVARRIAEAIAKDQAVCYTTSKSRVYALLSALLPGLVRRIIRKTIA